MRVRTSLPGNAELIPLPDFGGNGEWGISVDPVNVSDCDSLFDDFRTGGSLLRDTG